MIHSVLFYIPLFSVLFCLSAVLSISSLFYILFFSGLSCFSYMVFFMLFNPVIVLFLSASIRWLSCSILLYPVLLYSMLFYPVTLFYILFFTCSILFHLVLFCPALFCNVYSFTNISFSYVMLCPVLCSFLLFQLCSIYYPILSYLILFYCCSIILLL